ncbi:YpmS family protein [Granulicatella seriolae]|uniref:YpmS family protein n=1 Tax=Granulicatella seriolae TaxID=2967226 RepID=A0ABT1WLA1_9LACT|nr:YpmS family protein [Granulicatella seriolae]
MNEQETNQRRVQQNVKRNPWKIAFFSLLIGLILALGGTYLYIINLINSNQNTVNTISNQVTTSQPTSETNLAFDVNLTKAQLSQLLNQSLQDTNNLADPITIAIEDKVILKGTTEFLGLRVPYVLESSPFIMDNGNLQLKVDSFKLSGLSLPSSSALSSIGNQENLPTWLGIDSQNGLIVLQLNQLNFGEKNAVVVKSIDLPADSIVFSVSFSQEQLQKILEKQ